MNKIYCFTHYQFLIKLSPSFLGSRHLSTSIDGVVYQKLEKKIDNRIRITIKPGAKFSLLRDLGFKEEEMRLL